MIVEAFGITNVGMKRNHNEDAFKLVPHQHLYIVADGMGGHAAGEVASQIAIEEVSAFFATTAGDPEMSWPHEKRREVSYEENRLAGAVTLANQKIVEKALTDEQCKGMGTTIVALHFVDGDALVAHAGDSRVYLWRGGALRQVTVDHSLLNEYLQAGKITAAEAQTFPHKNVITRALGIGAEVEVEVQRLELLGDDLLLMCSDGLSGLVPEETMTKILARAVDLELACQQLIDYANANGGSDNVTCILARWKAPVEEVDL